MTSKTLNTGYYSGDIRGIIFSAPIAPNKYILAPGYVCSLCVTVYEGTDVDRAGLSPVSHSSLNFTDYDFLLNEIGGHSTG